MYNDCVIACPLQSIPSKQQSGSDSGGRAMRVRSKPVKYVISDEESGSSDWQQISDGSDSDFNWNTPHITRVYFMFHVEYCILDT